MTPTATEKAGELYSKYYNRIEHTLSEDFSVFEKGIVKHLALIAIDEIIEEIVSYADTDYLTLRVFYWKQVKEEIEKIKT